MWDGPPVSGPPSIAVKSATGSVLETKTGTADASGSFYWSNVTSRTVSKLQNGMHVVATDAVTGAVLDLRIVPVVFTDLDPFTGFVAGTAPPNTNVYIGVGSVGPSYYGVNTMTDSSGHWQAYLPPPPPPENHQNYNTWPGGGLFDPMTKPGVSVAVGNSVSVNVDWQIPSLRGDLTSDVVSGTDLAPLTRMNVSIYSAPGAGGSVLYSGSVVTDHTGSFTLTRKTDHVDLVAGQDIKVTVGSSPVRELTLVNLAIPSNGVTVAPPGQNLGDGLTITGTATPASEVLGCWSGSQVAGAKPGSMGGVGDCAWSESAASKWTVSMPWCSPGTLWTVTASVADGNWDFTTADWTPPVAKKH